MNTFGNIIGIIEYLDDHSKFLAAQVSTEWRHAVKCNTKGQMFTSAKRFITANVDDIIIHNEHDEVFIQDPMDTIIRLKYYIHGYKCGGETGFYCVNSNGRITSIYNTSDNILKLIEQESVNFNYAISLLKHNYNMPLQKKYYDGYDCYYCTDRRAVINCKMITAIVLFF